MAKLSEGTTWPDECRAFDVTRPSGAPVAVATTRPLPRAPRVRTRYAMPWGAAGRGAHPLVPWCTTADDCKSRSAPSYRTTLLSTPAVQHASTSARPPRIQRQRHTDRVMAVGRVPALGLHRPCPITVTAVPADGSGILYA
jgi:hypothetical protein